MPTGLISHSLSASRYNTRYFQGTLSQDILYPKLSAQVFIVVFYILDNQFNWDVKEKMSDNRTGQEEEKTVNFFRLFSFASKSDYSLMAIGVLSALGTGPCLALIIILFGDLTNTIVFVVAAGHIWPSANLTATNDTIDTRLFMKNKTNIVDVIAVFVYGTALACIFSVVFHIICVATFNFTARNQVIICILKTFPAYT